MAKILLVEDEERLSKVIQAKLRFRGHEVELAKTVKEALVMLNSVKYDAVWTDHYLPMGNGVELVAAMKADEKFKNMPVFVVSNTADGDDVYSYIQLGVTDYYIKSETKLDDVIDDIEAALSQV